MAQIINVLLYGLNLFSQVHLQRNDIENKGKIQIINQKNQEN